jgi:hypothetical protein
MADISAKTVMELRNKMGVSMMACKKALVEADGDMEKAIDILRKSGAAKADKKPTAKPVKALQRFLAELYFRFGAKQILSPEMKILSTHSTISSRKQMPTEKNLQKKCSNLIRPTSSPNWEKTFRLGKEKCLQKATLLADTCTPTEKSQPLFLSLEEQKNSPKISRCT